MIKKLDDKEKIMTNRALLLVDLVSISSWYGGALAVAEGDSTIDIANALIDWCQPRQIPVLASQTASRAAW